MVDKEADVKGFEFIEVDDKNFVFELNEPPEIVDEVHGEGTCSNDKKLLEQGKKGRQPIKYEESRISEYIAKTADLIVRILDWMNGVK
ncbi:hypothetical protein A2483_01600 [Candidatus Peregrinibacteria bacterium RIFOXYC2_FULL_33_13]|nr:MAG: hypothetical protein UR27_C0024G0003 [Candidatus Peregrinibacteria bacterium GW2011_GWA2_33_10]KKP38295.1 MAG: hypothetical protein UR30_C0021G0003 [Candidatus Peregrinibacteria bacterium GW2011_GWC2_33_13]OGJ55317.1 MAG: hypothetical protein A2483_01600 [Candidatus Peregrinibacteria bacterium RIFOXYC2_FULL_33_13]